MTESCQHYLPARRISARIVDGQLIILRPGSDELLRFNEVATFVWSILEKRPVDANTLITAITEEFEVDADQAKLDLMSFLNQMVAEGLIETKNDG